MRKILLPVALTAAISGGAGALAFGPAFAGAQTSTTTPSASAPAADSQGPLERALAKLVTNGTLTQAQADKVAAALKAELPLRGPGGPGFGHPGPGGVRLGLDAAATYLGMTDEALRTELQGGKTLKQVAEAKDKSVTGLIAALVKEAKAHIDEEVTNGRLTAAQATTLKAAVEARITEMVNNGMPLRGPGGPGHRGFRFGGTAPATTTSTA